MLTTGDKLLNMMKEEEVSIMELSRMSGVPERTIMDILAGIREPELGVVCRIADGLGICVHELRADEEQYTISIQKDTLAKLIVVSEINGVPRRWRKRPQSPYRWPYRSAAAHR